MAIKMKVEKNKQRVKHKLFGIFESSRIDGLSLDKMWS